MLPKEWKHFPLHRVAEVRTGVAKGKTGLKDSIELPYVRVANVQDGWLDLSVIKTIQIERSQIDRYALRKGDVLMTEGGDFDKLGRSAVWDAQINPCLHQNHIFAVRPDLSRLDPMFLSALAGSAWGRTYFLGCAKRSTNLASINSSQLKDFPILLPPLWEQRRISHLLSTWDLGISALDRLLSNSRNQKLLLAKALLRTSRRRDGSSTCQSAKLENFLTESRVLGSGGDTAQKLTVKLYGRGVIGKSERRGGSKATQYYCRSAGQFIYSKLDFLNGAFGLVPDHLDGYESTLDLPAFDISPGVDPRWFLYYVSREEFYLGHLGLANGGRKARRVNPSDLLKVSIELPALDEQKAIADLLDTAEAEVASFSAQLALLRQEKTALMAQLLTGKRRVRVDEEEKAVA